LAAIELRDAGLPGATAFEGLVYLVILLTGFWATAMAVVLPRVLGWTRDPSRRLTVLVGANALSGVLAATLRDEGRKVVVVDAVPWKLDPLRAQGLLTVRGDARDASTYEAAGVERGAHVLALTTNDELNLLVAELVRDEYRIDHPVVALQRPSEEFGRLRRAWVDLLGGRGFDVPRWMGDLENDRAGLATLPLDGEQAELMVRELSRPTEVDTLFVCAWSEGEPTFRTPANGLNRFDRVSLLVRGERRREVTEALAGRAAAEAVAPAPAQPAASAGRG
jgi:hypothetical protein